jgi:hypothetical protein
MVGLMLKKEKKTESWSWIERSVERHPDLQSWLRGVWQGRPRGGLVGVPTSKRPQIINVQYQRIPSKVLKGASILNVWSVETPRCLAWLQGVWQSHSRHADLKKVSNPSTQVTGSTWQGHQARTPQGGLHSRRKILGV